MKNNLPVLNYVTLPRLGAFQVIIDELSPVQLTKYGSGNDTSAVDDEDKSKYLHFAITRVRSCIFAF